MSPPSLSIVIPAYNEAERLTSTLCALEAHPAASDAELIVVDDGSTDRTAEVAHSLLDDRPGAQVISLAENRGKGAAVRTGVAAATGSIIVFMDADLATDLSALQVVLAALECADVVVGSRAVPGAVVHDTTLGRAVMGRSFNRMVRVMGRVGVHDTQCGFKAFRADAAHLIFGVSRVDGFAFDAEALVHARILGFCIREVPVEWTAVDGSSVRPVRDSIGAALDLLRVVVRTRPARVRARAAELGWEPPSSDGYRPQGHSPPA